MDKYFKLWNILKSNNLNKLIQFIDDNKNDHTNNYINEYNIDNLLILVCEYNCELFIIKYFIDNGANINKCNHNYITPLMVACQNNNLKIVQYLIENGADQHQTDYSNQTALFYVLDDESLDIVKYLFSKGIDINHKKDYKETPLILACDNISGGTKIVKFLIENGANINDVDRNKQNALFKACISNNFKIVKYLIKKGIDINHKDACGSTAIMLAFKSYKIIKYLINFCNIDINHKDKAQHTLLFLVCWNYNIKAAKYLLSLDIDKNTLNDENMTILDFVIAKNIDLNFVKLFLKHNIRNNYRIIIKNRKLFNLLVRYDRLNGCDIRIVIKNSLIKRHSTIVKYMFFKEKHLCDIIKKLII